MISLRSSDVASLSASNNAEISGENRKLLGSSLFSLSLTLCLSLSKLAPALIIPALRKGTPSKTSCQVRIVVLNILALQYVLAHNMNNSPSPTTADFLGLPELLGLIVIVVIVLSWTVLPWICWAYLASIRVQARQARALLEDWHWRWVAPHSEDETHGAPYESPSPRFGGMNHR